LFEGDTMKTGAWLAASIGLLIGASLLNSNTAHAIQAKPLTTISWYIEALSATETNDSLYNWMEARGRELGQRDLNTAGTQYSVVLFSFGQPRMVGTAYGASGYGRQLTASVIKEAARRYALGYWSGSGSDTASQLRMVLGTNNSGINNYSDQFLYNHGAAH
jgi:hypothetical protein